MTHTSSAANPPPSAHRRAGFTLIELLIVIAIITVIITLALPVYSNFSIRAKVGEALSLATTAKSNVSTVCARDPSIEDLSSLPIALGIEDSEYVESVEIAGPCAAPVIRIVTRRTGARTAPVLTVRGTVPQGAQHISWHCTADGKPVYIPEPCRNRV